MIPFGVKILWFVLSLTGLLTSWLVLIPLGRAIGAMWGPGMFCVGNTILQVIFCLGLIWRMNPFLMPKGFCLAQVLIIGFADFLLTGIAGAFSMATSLAVLRPRGWGDKTAMKWRKAFLIPVVVFPIMATVVHAVIVIEFDTVKPTDDLHCDSSDPEWARFFGYAGVPFIVALPCMFLSIKSLVIIWRANQKLQRTNRSLVFESVGNYTSLPPRCLKRGSVTILFKDPEPYAFGYQPSMFVATPVSGMTSAPSFVTANEYPPSPKTTGSPAPFILTGQSPTPVERKFHLPFRPSLAGTPVVYSFTEGNKSRTLPEDEENTSGVPSILPVCSRSVVQMRDVGNESNRSNQSGGAGSNMVGVHQKIESNISVDNQRSEIETQPRMSREEMRDDTSEVLGDATSGDVNSGRYMTPMEFVSQPSATVASASRNSPNLAPAIWRIILFQTAFCAVQILTCISTIIDLATHRPSPTPLGTQHFALLLAAWGPVVVFGHSPAVRKSLKFWGRSES